MLYEHIVTAALRQMRRIRRLILPRSSGHSVKRVNSHPEENNENQKESETTVVRNKYTAQFKEQVLERAAKDGIAKVAKDLGLAESMLYNWRAKRSQTGQPFEDQKLQQAEMARLKRENARLEEEVAFLKRRQRTLPNSPSEVRHD